jgi:seryl-tRNA synthetase
VTAFPPVPGLRWSANGQATLSGALLDLAERLDRRFVALARRWEPVELRFPALIAAAELDRIDYFRSFPQLATFPACLEADDANLENFGAGEPVGSGGEMRLSRLAPVRDVLTPAACYHLYVHHSGVHFDGPRYFTTRNTCFRRETHYVPLERQWSFTMREVVCLGTSEEARAFLATAREALDEMVASIGLPVEWATATDPFFKPSKNPRYLMQQVDPTKHELVFGGRLAVASANLHHDHFGRAFDIRRSGTRNGAAEAVHSACLAFGVERWLAAIVHHFGPDAGGWPEVGP